MFNWLPANLQYFFYRERSLPPYLTPHLLQESLKISNYQTNQKGEMSFGKNLGCAQNFLAQNAFNVYGP